jgi:hypothetical protein
MKWADYRKPSAKAHVIDDYVGKCCQDNSSRKSGGGTVRGNTSPDGRRPRRRDVKRREADAGCNRGNLKLFPKLASRTARRAFPKGTLAMVLRDELESIYTDEMFVDLFPKRGRPAEAPWRLAVVTVLPAD